MNFQYRALQSLAKLASALAQPTALLQPVAKAFAAQAIMHTVRSAELSRIKLNRLNLLSLFNYMLLLNPRHTCNLLRTILYAKDGFDYNSIYQLSV